MSCSDGADELDPAELGSDPEAQQSELRAWLLDQGFEEADIRAAVAADALEGLAGDHRLVPGRLHTRGDVLALTGLDDDVYDSVLTALGIVALSRSPVGEIGLNDAEVAMLATVGALSEHFTSDEAAGLLRVVGAAAARIGEAGVSLFLADVESPHVRSGGASVELARKVYDAVGLLDDFSTIFDPLVRRATLQAIERSRRAAIGGVERLRYRYAVGFVDLVGFTEVTGQMSSTELADFLRSFEAGAHEVVLRSGARVVKLIGDEVMFVADGAESACAAAVGLLERFGDADYAVAPRGGVAFGDVLVRSGDYYGSVVNVASRLADVAVPRELLVTEAVVVALPTVRFEPAGRRQLKGFPDPVAVWSLVDGTVVAKS
jgi:class 3 adenylate cyclase